MRVSVLLPMILAPVVVGLAWRTLILTPEYGILDYISISLGFGSKPWLGDPVWALISVGGALLGALVSPLHAAISAGEIAVLEP